MEGRVLNDANPQLHAVRRTRHAAQADRHVLEGVSPHWRTVRRQLRLGHHWVGWALLIALLLSPMMPRLTENAGLSSRDDQHSLWAHMRRSFGLDHHIDHPRVRYWIEWYQQHPDAIERYVRDGQPWLYHVFHEVNERHVPAEIALLPFIESGYNPKARNASGARGLWQLTPQAASEVNLALSPSYDPRHDPVASTRAALDYFQWLSDNWFDNDWILMLAVYNAGVGRVNKAIRLSDTRDFFQLPLPNETRHYVPRLLALSAIIDASDHYGIALPNVPDEPTFMSVRVSRDILFDSLGTQALPASILRDFNPAFQRIVERHQTLLIPLEYAPSVVCHLQARSALADMRGFPCHRMP